MNTETDANNNYYVKCDPSDEIQTYGGESTLYDTDENPYDEHIDYGIGFDGEYQSVNISGMNVSQYMRLGLEIINHLMVNGHSFEIKNDRQGNGEYLSIKH
jgi:hypothetical protein